MEQTCNNRSQLNHTAFYRTDTLSEEENLSVVRLIQSCKSVKRYACVCRFVNTFLMCQKKIGTIEKKSRSINSKRQEFTSRSGSIYIHTQTSIHK